MFLRFVTAEVDEESHEELGVFQAAYRLPDNGMLSHDEEEILQEIRDWFNKNLDKPTRFTTAKPPYYRITGKDKMESQGSNVTMYR